MALPFLHTTHTADANEVTVRIPTALIKTVALILLGILVVAGGLFVYNRVLSPVAGNIVNQAEKINPLSLENQALKELKRFSVKSRVSILKAEIITKDDFLAACEGVPGLDPAEVEAWLSGKECVFIRANVITPAGQKLTPYYRLWKSQDKWDIALMVPPSSAN